MRNVADIRDSLGSATLRLIDRFRLSNELCVLAVPVLRRGLEAKMVIYLNIISAKLPTSL